MEPGNLTELRIAIVKQALQLTSEQMKYWPAVEEAIRARAEARRARIKDLMALSMEPPADRNFVTVLETRADNLSARAAALKKLADAWKAL